MTDAELNEYTQWKRSNSGQDTKDQLITRLLNYGESIWVNKADDSIAFQLSKDISVFLEYRRIHLNDAYKQADFIKDLIDLVEAAGIVGAKLRGAERKDEVLEKHVKVVAEMRQMGKDFGA